MSGSIDVVIPARERYELTRDCLAHLARQSVRHRTILVDDASRDDSAERVRAEWPDVTLVALDRPLGYTGAVNRGVAAGTGEVVVLLNNDVQLAPQFLERLTEPLWADPRLGSAAALMLAPGARTIDSLGVVADPTLAGFARLHGLPAEAALRSDAAPVLTGPEGAAGAYRRSAWEEVGGLDATIVAYMEILDLALRLRSAGWQTVAVAQAHGIHLGSASYGRGSPEQRRLAGFSRGYLLRRYGVMRGAQGPRALATEALVVAADAAANRDLAALAGRLSGWRAAAGRPRRQRPPGAALDGSITLRRSLALRRGALRAGGGRARD